MAVEMVRWKRLSIVRSEFCDLSRAAFAGMIWRWSDDAYFQKFAKEMESKALSVANEEQRALVHASSNLKLYKLHEVQFRYIVRSRFYVVFAYFGSSGGIG
jgi:hypothetical protein